MPQGRRPPLSVARIIGKAHRIPILRALADSKEGLRYGTIDLEITRRSGTNLILIELTDAGLIVCTDVRYRITDEGRRRLSAAEALEKPTPASTRNGGVGVRNP